MPDEEQQVPPNGDPTGQVFVQPDDVAPDVTEEDPEATPRASALRTATVVSGRLVLGFVILGVVAIVLAAAILIPIPGAHTSSISALVKPAPTAPQVVCPGGLLRLGTSTGTDATHATALGAPVITGGASSGDVIPSAFAKSDANTGGGAAAPQLLITPPVASSAEAPVLGGAQSQSVATSEFTGLSSAACEAPTEDVWLVGGATSVGRTTLLLLANPTAVDAVVSIQIFGETGQVTAPGMDGITVAAGAQRVLSVAGFAPGLASPVVHVTSAGGQVVANLEQSTVRGLAPGGVDFVSGQASPLKKLVVPGVVVNGTQGVQAVIGQPGFEDLESTLRVFVPGSRSGTVTITELNEDGTVTGKPTKEKVAAGNVTDLGLDDLSDGNYTLVLSSTVPVVAGVRVSTASGAATDPVTDFAWFAAAPLLTANSIVSIPTGMASSLHLDNPTATSETVRLDALVGSSLTVTVKPHSATSVAVASGISYELEGFSRLYAAVGGTTDGGVTGYVVCPATLGAAPLRVYG
ncbi:MAG TPA: DUF5719 family protein [Galbitalea sp.]|jgi:hypothetical protein|nr:DUF5719 family protein [Galbitalea sp.]